MPTKEELLGTSPAVKGVDVEGVGIVYVREATGAAFDYISEGKGDIDSRGLLARAVVATVCDENGSLLFSRGDYGRVNDMPIGRLKAIGEAALMNCGIAPEDTDDLVGN